MRIFPNGTVGRVGVNRATPADEPRRVLFRVDASETMGAGHLVRCLAIATELRDRGIHSTFLVADMAAPYRAWIHEARHELLGEREAASLSVGGYGWAVVDHYGLDAEWIDRHRSIAARWLAIDDLVNRPLPVDVLVNPNPWVESGAYSGLVNPTTRLLVGTNFAPIRREFVVMASAPRTFETAGQVFVGLGGGSAGPATATAVAAVRQGLPNARISVVTGPGGEPVLDREGAADPRVDMLGSVAAGDLAKLMAAADLAIGAGGTSSWERCVLGLPTIVVHLADNQAPVAAALARAGAAIDIGPVATASVERLAEAIRDLAADPAAREAMSDRARHLVDGRGAARIANVLEGVRVRAAAPSDARLLWTWANDPATRANSLHPAPIPWAVHEAWIARRLADPRTVLLIGENAAGPVGQVRFEPGETVEVSIAVAPDRRGELLGELLLAASLDELRRRGERGAIHARVKSENEASRRLFETFGFQPESPHAGVLSYFLPGER